MYKYKRAKKIGFNDGINDKKYDIKNKKIKKLKEIDEKKLLSQMYDLGYVEGYNKYNYTYFKKKNK